MYTRVTTVLCGAVLFALVSCAGFDFSALQGSVSGGETPAFSKTEAVHALKDALSEGALNACTELSAEDGYFGHAALKILLPPEAKIVMESAVRIPGGQALLNDVLLRINRSAEKAAAEAYPLFLK